MMGSDLTPAATAWWAYMRALGRKRCDNLVFLDTLDLVVELMHFLASDADHHDIPDLLGRAKTRFKDERRAIQAMEAQKNGTGN